MQLTFILDTTGHTFSLQLNGSVSWADVKLLVQGESGITPAEQCLSLNGAIQDNLDGSCTLDQMGWGEDCFLTLSRKVTIAGRETQLDAEMMRLQALGDPNIMRPMRQSHPEMAEAASSNPARFAELLRQLSQRQAAVQSQLDHADPYDIEAQRKIEEAIRQQRVMENLELAMEHSPETFGRVNMLYIQTEVNGHKVKAFVDSGAQSTIMRPECAEACGIMRLCDTRFSGTAVGVGTAKILGRVHSAQIKVGNLHLACSFTIMENKGVDLLFGLDMLKSHQACIDLRQNKLIIQNESVPFLAEHEIPNSFGQNPEDLPDSISTTSGMPDRANANAQASTSSLLTSKPHDKPSTSSASTTEPAKPTPNEESIKVLMGLGASRSEAIEVLELAGGNVDAAASMLF